MIVGRVNISDIRVRRMREVAVAEAATFHAVARTASDRALAAWAEHEMLRAHADLRASSATSVT